MQRACGTSLTAALQIAQRVESGEIEAGIAGGVDTTSEVPIVYGRTLNAIALESARARSLGARISPWLRLRPRDLKPLTPGVGEPRTGMSMGEHCELMAKEWAIGRREQDELALASHLKAAAAWKAGFYDDLVDAAARAWRPTTTCAPTATWPSSRRSSPCSTAARRARSPPATARR